MKNKRNPISFLEDSFLAIKEYLDAETNNQNVFFSASYIEQLRQETTVVIALCDVLNNDADFIPKINAMAGSNKSNGLLLKTEHFFISDLIAAYNQNLPAATEKSMFTLAYYYDVLRNRHFADEKEIKSLNKLVQTAEFHASLKKIVTDNTIPKAAGQGNYFLSSILSEANGNANKQLVGKIDRFLEFAFEGKATAGDTLASASTEPEVPRDSQISECPEGDTLEKVLEELNQLIGLEAVKNDVRELINLLEIQKKRSTQGLKNIDITLHTVFLGPPGTGKTTVARLLSRIYKHLGFLSKGQLYETDREGLIAGYVGQTAAKVDKAVTESKGGVLFVDEAYSLAQAGMGNDYGAEAVNTLLKRMEDYRDDLAVVVAGYTEPMQVFIESNPGLRSRFNRYFHFAHFSPEELFRIFEMFCKASDFVIAEDAREKLSDTFELLYTQKDENFGNARVVRNLFEKCVQNQANRIIKLSEISQKILKTFEEQDIPEPKDTQTQVNFFK